MQIMAPYYAASPGFQRFYRVDDFRQRTVCDDWGLLKNKVASGRPKDQFAPPTRAETGLAIDGDP